MGNELKNLKEILDSRVSGYHQYILSDPPRMTFASRNLCELTGYTKAELLSAELGYASLVHEADRERYDEFLRGMAQREQTRTACYRLRRKDGAALLVCDTAVSVRDKDGRMRCDSVLSDVTALQTENEDLRALHETLPYGFVRYTCEAQPRVTYANEQMRRIVRFPESAWADPASSGGQISQFIPMEERGRFAHFLAETSRLSRPVSGELTVLRCDGTKGRVYGWATKCVNARGEQEFQSVCMDVTERYRSHRAQETQQYLRALSDVYDKIFAYDFSDMTVRYVHGVDSASFERVRDIPMQMEEAISQWVEHTVHEEDRPGTRAFFRKLCQRQFPMKDGRPEQIRFRARSSAGEMQEYIGLFIQTGELSGLFCCRRIRLEPETERLRLENQSLRSLNENMQELMLRFTDGIIAFEVAGEQVRPLYASDNVCLFFGYTREEWLDLMKQQRPLRDFVARCGVAYEEFRSLLDSGEGEFTYRDLRTDTDRRIQAVCSHRSPDSGVRYVMLYHVAGSTEQGAGPAPDRVYLRTFGYFDVFVDGKPIAFRNEKSKELFALLADRRGGYVSSEEAIGFLWEDEAVTAVTLARYRKVALRLKNILEEYGIADVVESVNGKRRLVTEKVRCDLYDYLSGREEYAQLFKGTYLMNYSWGEITLGELLNDPDF